MKLFTDKFIQTLIFNVATISAIVVGIVQFAVRAYNENNGNEKVRKMVQTALRFVDALVERAEVLVTDPAPVAVAKVAQKRTKGA